MSERITFRCPYCNAKIGASSRYIGRETPCPRCKEHIRVPPQTPEEQSPVLAMDDSVFARVLQSQ